MKEANNLDDFESPAGKLPLAARVVVPFLIGLLFLAFWEFGVRYFEVSKFVLPPPSSIIAALIDDFPSLMMSLWNTLRVTLEAFVAALVLGVLFAVLFAQSRLFEISLFPYAVVLQVTPIVSIAPLILIWVGLNHVDRALLILATIVAFFPILANTTFGLKSADHNLRNLFDLYHATRWQRLIDLEFPSALPYLLAGAKISGGLALIGTVVAEFVAGSGSGTGLAWRIIESGNRLNIARMFAALLLLSALGISIFFLLSAVERLLLKNWHESAVGREN
jgi:NitT/TauT family transport system permease protein